MKIYVCPKCYTAIPEKARTDKIALPWRIRCQCQIGAPAETYAQAVQSWNDNISNGVAMRPMPEFKPAPKREPAPPPPPAPPPDKSYIDDQDKGREVELGFDITCRKCGGVAHIKLLSWIEGDDGYFYTAKEVYILCDECENSQEIT